jgi:hypothetical protein
MIKVKGDSKAGFQRAADGNGNSRAIFRPRASNYTHGRVRSSIGARVLGASHGDGTKSRASGERRRMRRVAGWILVGGKMGGRIHELMTTSAPYPNPRKNNMSIKENTKEERRENENRTEDEIA